VDGKCTGKRDKEMEEVRSIGGHEKRVARVEEGAEVGRKMGCKG
jgi:hypothetical protein